MRGLFQHARRDNHEEIHARVRKVHAARVGNPERELAAQDVHTDAVADIEAHAFGKPGVKRQQWRTLVVFGPPLALDELVVGAGRIAIGEAAVAVERPLHFLFHVRILDGHALDLRDAPAQHRDEREIGCAGLDLHELPEILGLGGLDADEEEAWGHGWCLFTDHAANVCVDQCNGGQQRQPKSQGQDDGRRGRTRPIDVRQRQSRHHDLGARDVPRKPHQSPACRPQDRKGRERTGGKACRQFDVGRERYSEGRQQRQRKDRRQRIGPTGPAARRRDQVTEHHRRRDVLGAGQRPDGEGQRGQEPVGHGRAERCQEQSELRLERQEARQQPPEHNRQDRADQNPCRHADDSERHDFTQEHEKDEAAARANALERRDVIAAAIEVGLHGAGNAYAADHEGGQADQREERADLLDEATYAERGVPPVADLPVLVRIGVLYIFDEVRHAFA